MKSFDDFLSSVNDESYDNLAKLVASKYDIELTPHDDRLIRISVSLMIEYLSQYHEWLSKSE
jgi:hypothetical protein